MSKAKCRYCGADASQRGLLPNACCSCEIQHMAFAAAALEAHILATAIYVAARGTITDSKTGGEVGVNTVARVAATSADAMMEVYTARRKEKK